MNLFQKISSRAVLFNVCGRQRVALAHRYSTTPESEAGESTASGTRTSSIFKGTYPVERLTGNVEVDGLTRYDLELFETAEWVKDLLGKMKNDSSSLAEKVSKTMENYAPPAESTPVCLQTSQTFTYDFSVPKPLDNEISLSVRVSDLPLKTKESVHKFILLAGDKYDAYRDVVTLSMKRTKEESVGEALDKLESMQILSKQLDRMVKECVSTKDFFTDVPLNLSHVKKSRGVYAFPPEWLPQRNAEPDTIIPNTSSQPSSA